MDHEWIYGRHAVREAQRAGRRTLYRLRLAKGVQPKGIVAEVLEAARERGVTVEEVERRVLDALSDGHQGLALEVSPYPYVSIEEFLAASDRQAPPPLYLLLDLIQDPQNLGTLLRTAEAAGVDGALLPAHRAAGVTPAVVNASSGASEHLRIVRANLAQAIHAVKQRGVWVMGLEGGPGAIPLNTVDLARPLAIVLGGEAAGLRPLVRRECDLLAAIPMHGRIESLNAAVAGSIALYAARLANPLGGRAGGMRRNEVKS
ncbi:MAG: 23S rRNA (guanosine(2251)-2'-O)-methyltransferase RlmB [Chloroflexi bacterium]|jgi:23S rRNA (guanosine2251-2'-O)-methyltransferase|nr:23S rRNA (guanosine(2251)-2'-O)-methyltransferase RlmB [Chloroflexota bacterium]